MLFRSVNWFFNELLSYAESGKISEHITPKEFAAFLSVIDKDEISGKIGKDVLKKSFDTKRSLLDIIEKDGCKQISNPEEIRKIIQKVIDKNQAQLADYRSGKDKLFGYFVGEVMKASKGKANPAQANQLLKEMLQG